MAIREGYIIEEIVDYSNMSDAFDEVLRGTTRKRCSEGRYLEKANKLSSMPITIGWDDSNGFGHYIFT